MNILKKIKGLTIPVMVIALCLISYAPVQAAAMHDITTGDVIFTNDAQVTADLRVDGTTMVVDGAANTVSLGGATTVTTGGLTVSAGGLTVTDGNTSFGNGGDTITLGSGATDTITVSGTMTTTPLLTAAGGLTVSTGQTFTSDTVNIDGGAIDGTVIGANTAAAATFTTIGGTLTTASQPNVTTLAGATSIGATTVTTTLNGPITASEGLTVTSGQTFTTDTADINGGAIDGTTIGATTPAAATLTDLTANGNTTLGNDATADSLTLSGSSIAGASPLIFEGNTPDAFELTIAVPDVAADQTYTIPTKTGAQTFAMLSDLTASSSELVNDIDTYVAGGVYAVADAAPGPAADVDVELYAAGSTANPELTELHIHSLFPTVSFKISATDTNSTVVMYGPGTSEITVDVCTGTPDAIGNTGITVCVDNTDNLLTFSSSGGGIVGNTHSFGFSMLAKPSDG